MSTENNWENFNLEEENNGEDNKGAKEKEPHSAEEWPESEEISSIDRMVGGSKEEREYLKKLFCSQFENQNFAELEGKEKPKTPEQERIIELVNSTINRIREKYNLKDFEMPSENIHVIDHEQWIHEDNTGAFYWPLRQAVYIRDNLANTVFSECLLHDCLHFKSYNALQKRIGYEKFSDYRMGLLVFSRKGDGRYFSHLTEAVTEELTKEYIFKLWEDPIFEEELKETEKLKKECPQYDDEEIYCLEEFEREDGEMRVRIEKFSYKEERDNLLWGIEKIFQENQDKFSSREDVWDIFVKSMLDGNLIPLGRIIEKTFGKGSFRRLGEGEEFKNLIN